MRWFNSVTTYSQIFHCSGLLLLLLLSHFSRIRLCATPLDSSPPGSPIPGILQARTLEWVCHFLLQCMKVKSLSHVWLLATPWIAAYQAPPSMGFSRQEYWSGVPLPSLSGLLGKANQCFQEHFQQLITLRMLFSWPFYLASSSITLSFILVS